MKANRSIQEKSLSEVARALGELRDKTVFVGGSVAGLYVDDPAAEDVRVTKDVDIVIEVAGLARLEDLRVELEQNT